MYVAGVRDLNVVNTLNKIQIVFHHHIIVIS